MRSHSPCSDRPSGGRDNADPDGGLVAAARLAPLLGLTVAKMTNRSDS
jgi:hypothetical protein